MNMDFLLGNAIRMIKSDEKQLYLTFDDGPEPEYTPRVLEILDNHQIKATFFVVARKVQKHPKLTQLIQKSSHSFGNHSLDHSYKNFFRGKRTLANWIKESENIISNEIGNPTVGFRPPAGVRTPELKWALEVLQMPMILWNVRFFDRIFNWKLTQAKNSLKKTKNGSIILLHDHQKPDLIGTFLETLDHYIILAKENGFQFASLSREKAKTQFSHQR